MKLALHQEENLMLGESQVMQELRVLISQFSGNSGTVLISGETGTGKELVARQLHSSSARSSHPFVAVNCAGMAENLLESELFGHVRGSFTSAHRDRPGKIEAAADGTLFLDEIGEMSLKMQASLLRFLSTGEVQKVGEDVAISTRNVRTIVATNRNLKDEVAENRFRQDLYFRLNILPITIAPLRERIDDVPLLVDHFLERYRQGRRSIRISREALKELTPYLWPGNVRELESMIQRIVLTIDGDTIEPRHLPHDFQARTPDKQSFKERRRSLVNVLYEQLLDGEKSFWSSVYAMYMDRDLTRADIRQIITWGLERSKGNYKILTRLFHMPESDYKRFLNFLRKHHVHLRFQEYRR